VIGLTSASPRGLILVALKENKIGAKFRYDHG
jgi:hypothetical protein